MYNPFVFGLNTCKRVKNARDREKTQDIISKSSPLAYSYTLRKLTVSTFRVSIITGPLILNWLRCFMVAMLSKMYYSKRHDNSSIDEAIIPRL